MCKIQTYVITPDAEPVASVLLVHGWTGEAAFMGAFGEFLRRRGYRAVLLDLPAHGESEGREASLFDCARAVLEIAEAFGPIRFALGHSIGAMAVLTAGEGHHPLPRGFSFDAYVLVSMPNEFCNVTRDLGAELGLTPAAQFAFERRLEYLASRRASGLPFTNGPPAPNDTRNQWIEASLSPEHSEVSTPAHRENDQSTDSSTIPTAADRKAAGHHALRPIRSMSKARVHARRYGRHGWSCFPSRSDFALHQVALPTFILPE